MNKTLVALGSVAAFLVVAYLGYELLAPNVNRCEGIFQQTAPGLEANVKFLESEGGAVLGRKQIQELSDHAQEIALNLKSCCVMAGSGNFEQFNQCKASALLYDKEVTEAVEAVKSVSDASGSGQVQDPKEAEERLAQILQAANAASAALEQQVAEISSKQGQAADPSTDSTEAQQGPGTLQLRAALAKGGDIVPSCFEVYDPKEDLQGNLKMLARQCSNPSVFELPAGHYAVFAIAGNTTVRSDATVAAGQRTDTVIDLNAGYLGTQALLAEGGERASACFDVYESKQDIQGNRKHVARQCSDQSLFLLPAGDYLIEASSGYVARSVEIGIPAGGRTDRHIALNAGYLRAFAELTSGGERVSACYEVYDAKEDVQGNHKQIGRACDDKEARMTLPAGDYMLSAQSGNALSSTGITIAAGQPTRQSVVLNAGYLVLQAQVTGDPQPVSACYDIYRAKQDVHGNRDHVARACTERAVFTLTADSYFVRTQSGDATADLTVDVEAGERADHTVALPKP